MKLFWEGPGNPPDLGSTPLEWTGNPLEAHLSVRGASDHSLRKPDGSISALTPREREILPFLADGWSNEEIADRLGISLRTVKFHVSGLLRSLGVTRRSEAVREALVRGLIQL